MTRGASPALSVPANPQHPMWAKLRDMKLKLATPDYKCNDKRGVRRTAREKQSCERGTVRLSSHFQPMQHSKHASDASALPRSDTCSPVLHIRGLRKRKSCKLADRLPTRFFPTNNNAPLPLHSVPPCHCQDQSTMSDSLHFVIKSTMDCCPYLYETYQLTPWR